MNTKIITAIALATVLTSCSSLYKATSTPDDVYYSPSPSVKVNGQSPAAKNDGNDIGYDRYDSYQTRNDDDYLHMKVRNNTLWSGIDDYAYWQDSRYDFGYSCSASRMALMGSYYSPYSYGMYGAWNPLYGYTGGFGYGYYGYGGGGFWGSPYQTVVLYKNPRTYFGNTSKSNLTAYRNIQYNNSNYSKNLGGYGNGGRYNNANGNLFSNRNNTYSNSNNNLNSQPARSFSSGSSSNSAGGRSGGFNSSGSSAPASRPTRH